MYPIVVLMGVVQSIALNTALNFIGENIGTRGDQGAIVYGIYGFVDKLSNGIIIFLITVTLHFIFSQYFQEFHIF